MKHASLFSGIGGPEVAAAMLGWENVFHCEINPFGRRVLEYWFPESVSYEDIKKTSFKEWRGRVDVLTGGFPCQPFSYAGKRGGREDERYLWPEMLRAIDEIRPTWVVGENVAGITTMVEGGVLTPLGGDTSLFAEGYELHRYEQDQSFTIERICGDLECLGYSVQPVLVPAAAVGAPHRRDRVFIIALITDPASEMCNGRGAQVGRERQANPNDEEHAIQSAVVGYGEKRPTPNPDGKGREKSIEPGRGEDREEEGARLHDRTERPRRDGYVTNAEGEQCDGNRPCESEIGIKAEVKSGRGIGEEGVLSSADTYRTLFQIWNGKATGGRSGSKFGTESSYSILFPENRWAEFPTVSPVHRGNDGFPFDVDDLTISFTKWRTESLKAYGNAIVPQVMYRIFQAIESVSCSR